MSLNKISVNDKTVININNELKGNDQLISDFVVYKEMQKIYEGNANLIYRKYSYSDIYEGTGYFTTGNPYEVTESPIIGHSKYINVSGCSGSKITFYGWLYNMLVFFYDKDYIFLNNDTMPPGYEAPEVRKKSVIDVPYNAYYVRFNLGTGVEDLGTYVEFIENESIVTINGWECNPESGYIDSSGTIHPEKFYHTDFIDVSYRADNNLTYEGMYFFWTIFAYDSEKEFISMISFPYDDNVYDTRTFEVPSDTQYLRINIDQGFNSILTIEKQKVIRTPANGITITTSQITDYEGGGGGGETGTYSIKYKISKALYALGDSVTWGVGDTSEAGGWAQRVSNKIEFTNFYKYAVSGATSMHAERGWLSQQISRIPTNSTDFILVMIGTNDCNLNYTVDDVDVALAKSYSALDPTASFSESFRSDMESLKRKCPLATIIYCLPVSNSSVNEPRMENYLEVMRKVCQWLSIPVLETRNEVGIPQRLNLGISSTWMSDSLHPGPNWHELVAKYVAVYLMRYADQLILS